MDPEILAALEAIKTAKQNVVTAEVHLEWLQNQCTHKTESHIFGSRHITTCTKCGKQVSSVRIFND